MKILYIVGNNLQENTSANISHNAYIKGLIENNCDVDILMKSRDGLSIDKNMPKFNANYIEVSGVGMLTKLINKYKSQVEGEDIYSSIQNERSIEEVNQIYKKRVCLKLIYDFFRNLLKKVYYTYIKLIGGVYENHIFWIKNASKLNFEEHYDAIISNSTPNSAHKVAFLLIKNSRVSTDHWIQIWEDPWFYDLYCKKNKNIKKEEEKLLNAAEKIYYVSPLTLENQKKNFKSAANKMDVIPLPSMDNNEIEAKKIYECGYFGDYYSTVRNIIPFYKACMKLKINTAIVGNTDENLKQQDNILIKGRVSIKDIETMQSKSNILIHLSNLYGGQIPGKIYHYSNTNHPILVILDGTKNEKRAIYDYFKKYNRYWFCNNDEKSIENAIKEIIATTNKEINKPVENFYSYNIAKKIIENIKGLNTNGKYL